MLLYISKNSKNTSSSFFNPFNIFNLVVRNWFNFFLLSILLYSLYSGYKVFSYIEMTQTVSQDVTTLTTILESKKALLKKMEGYLEKSSDVLETTNESDNIEDIYYFDISKFQKNLNLLEITTGIKITYKSQSQIIENDGKKGEQVTVKVVFNVHAKNPELVKQGVDFVSLLGEITDQNNSGDVSVLIPVSSSEDKK